MLTILYENRDLIYKSSLTFISASVASLEQANEVIKLISGLIAIIVGLLTIYKLSREMFFKKTKNQKE